MLLWKEQSYVSLIFASHDSICPDVIRILKNNINNNGPGASTTLEFHLIIHWDSLDAVADGVDRVEAALEPGVQVPKAYEDTMYKSKINRRIITLQ